MQSLEWRILCHRKGFTERGQRSWSRQPGHWDLKSRFKAEEACDWSTSVHPVDGHKDDMML